MGSKSLASRMADNIVKAYISHDNGHFEKSSKYFSRVFMNLFTDCNSSEILKACHFYVDALRQQDQIENDKFLTLEQKLENPDWERLVSASLSNFCNLTKLDVAWANHTANFFRYHGAPKIYGKVDLRYIPHVLEAERILINRITGDTYWADFTGPIYLTLISCHDKHDKNGLLLGRELSEVYFSILLTAKNKKDADGKKRAW